MAPLRRNLSGAFTPKAKWLHNAESSHLRTDLVLVNEHHMSDPAASEMECRCCAQPTGTNNDYIGLASHRIFSFRLVDPNLCALPFTAQFATL